jgi:hypothetical protein
VSTYSLRVPKNIFVDVIVVKFMLYFYFECLLQVYSSLVLVQSKSLNLFLLIRTWDRVSLTGTIFNKTQREKPSNVLVVCSRNFLDWCISSGTKLKSSDANLNFYDANNKWDIFSALNRNFTI